MSILPWILVGLVAAWLAGKRSPEPAKVTVPAESKRQAGR
jgi:uncharacterized membrane protein YeaQ/YmgE (transglycosylase-associated protein family)